MAGISPGRFGVQNSFTRLLLSPNGSDPWLMVSQFASQTSDANQFSLPGVKVEALLFPGIEGIEGVVRRANERRADIEPLRPYRVSKDLPGP